MYAHYTETGNLKEVLITRSPSIRTGGLLFPFPQPVVDTGGNFVARIAVKGRREARRIADQHCAICWNF